MNLLALPLASLLALPVVPFSASSAAGQDLPSYVVLAGFAPADPYDAAAQRLASHHGGCSIVHFDPGAPEAVLEELRRLEPANVAIVLRPEQIHVDSVRAILKMATRVDDDPFVDFDYGYITGATAVEAEQFVTNIVTATGCELPRKVGQSAVWTNKGGCTANDIVYILGSRSLPSRSLIFRPPAGASGGASADPHGRDQEFLAAELKTLQGCGALLIGGHGMPWEIVSGPRTEDVESLDLFPAVAFNYACYTGVTRSYAQREYERRVVTNRVEEIALERSFALAMLRRGVVGYVAYVTPRPAGPEMTIDLQRALAGSTIGQTRRNDYAKVVLGYLGFGETGIAVAEVAAAERLPRSELDMVRHQMLDAATGGILYGDPAFRPFPVGEAGGEAGGAAADVLPLRAEAVVAGEELHVVMRLRGRDVYVWGADPFRRFGEGMAMKVYDRVVVPEGFGAVQSVYVSSASWGGKAIETLPVVWAEERDRGRRFLHVKVNFARRSGTGDVEFRVVASPKAAPAAAVKAIPGAGKPTTAGQRVRAANTRLGRDPLGLAAELEKLASSGSLGQAGFAAVIDLIGRGEAHPMTVHLLRATKVEGGEKRLLDLARSYEEGGRLVGRGGLDTVLLGLGEFDTVEVRDHLLAWLGRDAGQDAVVAAASALARLREPRAVEPIAEHLRKFDEGWSRVEWQLVHALGELGGKAASGHLVAYTRDERAVNEVAVWYACDHLLRLDPARGKQAVTALLQTDRCAAFSERTRDAIAGLAR